MTELEHGELVSLEQSRDPLWFKRAVFYEVLIRGFSDSNGDGTGDIKGLLIPGVGIVDVRSKVQAVPGARGAFTLKGQAEAVMRRLDNSFFRTLGGGLPRLRSNLALAPGGQLVVVDLVSHTRTDITERLAHRWPGFGDTAMRGLLQDAGLHPAIPLTVPGAEPGGFAVRLWPARAADAVTGTLTAHHPTLVAEDA